MITLFTSLNSAIQAAIIGALTTIVTGIVGFAVLIWRLRREAERAIRELRAAEAMKLKLRIYEQEVIEVVDRIVDAEVALSTYIRLFENDLNNHQFFARQGMLAATPKARIPELIRLKSEFDFAAIAIVTFVEKWLVIDPRLSIFQSAINAAIRDVTATWGAYFEFMVPVMPTDLPDGTRWNPPNDQVATKAIHYGNALLDKLETISSYSTDFRAEMQSLLIGPLFDNAVPRREPIDPRHLVISLKDADALTKKFDASNWGAEMRSAQERARSHVRARGESPLK